MEDMFKFNAFLEKKIFLPLAKGQTQNNILMFYSRIFQFQRQKFSLAKSKSFNGRRGCLNMWFFSSLLCECHHCPGRQRGPTGQEGFCAERWWTAAPEFLPGQESVILRSSAFSSGCANKQKHLLALAKGTKRNARISYFYFLISASEIRFVKIYVWQCCPFNFYLQALSFLLMRLGAGFQFCLVLLNSRN